MAPRWGDGVDRDNAERVIHRPRWGWRRPDRCRRCVYVPERWGGGLARAAIAWCDPGRAVVCVSLASDRSWMVLPASRVHRASGVAEAVRRERRRRMSQGAGVDRTGSETFSEHV